MTNDQHRKIVLDEDTDGAQEVNVSRVAVSRIAPAAVGFVSTVVAVVAVVPLLSQTGALGQEAAPPSTLPYSHARGYPQQSSAVWAAARDLVAEWDLERFVEDEASQLLVSNWKPLADFDGPASFSRCQRSPLGG